MTAAQDPRYEEMDGPVRGILGFGVALVSVVLLSLGLLQWLFGIFQRTADEADIPRHPLAQDVVSPPEPRLLADPDSYFEQYMAEQRARLESPAWIDESAGVVRIPIERAIELSLEEGFSDR